MPVLSGGNSANRLDPDQARSKLYDTLVVFLKEIFEKNDFENKSFKSSLIRVHSGYFKVKTFWCAFEYMLQIKYAENIFRTKILIGYGLTLSLLVATFVFC